MRMYRCSNALYFSLPVGHGRLQMDHQEITKYSIYLVSVENSHYI